MLVEINSRRDYEIHAATQLDKAKTKNPKVLLTIIMHSFDSGMLLARDKKVVVEV